MKLSKNLEAATGGGGGGGGNKQAAKTNTSNEGENPNKKNKDKKEHRMQKEEEAWKKVLPKSGESHKKKVNGKEYHFCIHHNAGWCTKAKTAASKTNRRVTQPFLKLPKLR